MLDQHPWIFLLGFPSKEEKISDKYILRQFLEVYLGLEKEIFLNLFLKLC
jgi:hypothetical protein